MEKTFEYYLEIAKENNNLDQDIYEEGKIRDTLNDIADTLTISMIATMAFPVVIPRIIITTYNQLKGKSILENPDKFFEKVFTDAKKINPEITKDEAKVIFNKYLKQLKFDYENNRESNFQDQINPGSISRPIYKDTVKKSKDLPRIIAKK